MVELIRISEAAERLGVTRQRMYQLITTHKLPTVEMLGLKVIDALLLERPELKERHGGRPSKK